MNHRPPHAKQHRFNSLRGCGCDFCTQARAMKGGIISNQPRIKTEMELRETRATLTINLPEAPVKRQLPVAFWYAVLGACWTSVMALFATIIIVSGSSAAFAVWTAFGGAFGLAAGLTFIYWARHSRD